VRIRPSAPLVAGLAGMEAIAGRLPGGRPLRRRREIVLVSATRDCEGTGPSRNRWRKRLSGNELQITGDSYNLLVGSHSQRPFSQGRQEGRISAGRLWAGSSEIYRGTEIYRPRNRKPAMPDSRTSSQGGHFQNCSKPKPAKAIANATEESTATVQTGL
jgi:hypothetical protein